MIISAQRRKVSREAVTAYLATRRDANGVPLHPLTGRDLRQRARAARTPGILASLRRAR